MSDPQLNTSSDVLLVSELGLPYYDFNPDDFDSHAGQAVRCIQYSYKGPCKLDQNYRSEALRRALATDLPVCSVGTFPVSTEDLVLYFGKDKDSIGRIDFSSPEDGSLRQLADVCDAATFGVNDQNVFDQTYRKAGKLDSQYFSAKFDPMSAGLLDRLREVLLVGHPDDVSIRAELYKLNVYGPGSFFKSHKDTPRGDNMFASLVIVYPTAHRGGSLRFQHGTFDDTFDSAAAVAEAIEPSVAFAAFYSDIDHEVSLVESGYRVTLTYNLYHDSARAPRLDNIFSKMQERTLRAALHNILSDKTFIKDGGFVAFGMSHQYPTSSLSVSCLSDITTLKGKDAILMKVCRDMSLEPKVQIVYENFITAGPIICDKVLPSGGCYDDFCDVSDDIIELGGKLANGRGNTGIPVIDVKWITPVKTVQVKNEVKTPVVSYGNEPSLGHVYGNFCILVEIKRS